MTDEMKDRDSRRFAILIEGTDEIVAYEAADGAAEKKAKELALENPQDTYAVYQKVGTAKAELESKWVLAR